MAIDPVKLHELAMQYDPFPVLAAIEASIKGKAAPAVPDMMKGLMQVPGQSEAQPVKKSPWG